MLKIEDMVGDLNNLDEATLAQLSDKLWNWEIWMILKKRLVRSYLIYI